MKYQIKGGNLPILELILDRNERIITEKGAMAWRSSKIDMETSTNGGLLKGLARSFSGESIFLNKFTSTADNQILALGTSLPGEMKVITLNGTKNLICQKRAFLASEESVNLDVVFTKKFSAGFFGGEGFILQRLSGHGTAFLEIDGSLIEHELHQGEELLVDQGYIAYFDETINYEVTTVKGAKNILLGGEGLILVKLTGFGKVGLQTLPASNVASALIPFIPTSSN